MEKQREVSQAITECTNSLGKPKATKYSEKRPIESIVSVPNVNFPHHSGKDIFPLIVSNHMVS